MIAVGRRPFEFRFAELRSESTPQTFGARVIQEQFPVSANNPVKISIVTPSHKQLDWLKLCAASIADHEGVTFEHIIQDFHLLRQITV